MSASACGYRPESRLTSKFAHGVTIFTSAFLLFQVQPIIAKSPLDGLWRICMHKSVMIV